MLRALLVLSLFTGCATSEVEDDDLDSIELGDDKADLPSRPTEKGALVTGPSQRWSDSALDFYHPIDHVYWAIVDFVAPETGTYEVIATSVWNMRLFPVPKTWGDYVLTQMSERCDDDGVC